MTTYCYSPRFGGMFELAVTAARVLCFVPPFIIRQFQRISNRVRHLRLACYPIRSDSTFRIVQLMLAPRIVFCLGYWRLSLLHTLTVTRMSARSCPRWFGMSKPELLTTCQTTMRPHDLRH